MLKILNLSTIYSEIHFLLIKYIVSEMKFQDIIVFKHIINNTYIIKNKITNQIETNLPLNPFITELIKNYLLYCSLNKIRNEEENLQFIEITNWFQENANKGNYFLFTFVGILLRDGYILEENFEESFKYFKLAVENQYIEAEPFLAKMYFNGFGTRKNIKIALDLFNKSSERGNLISKYELGCYYIDTNFEKGLNYLIESSNMNFPPSLNSLGYLYKAGEFCEPNIKQSMDYFKKSSDLDDDDAQYELRVIYKEGNMVRKNYLKSFEFLSKSADQENFQAMCELGELYFSGFGVKKDIDKALEFFIISAEEGVSKAQNNLGYCYQNGIGVEKNDGEAFKWYKIAAKGGSIVSLNNLATFYEKGIYKEQNLRKAIQLYKEASDSGSQEASHNLIVLFHEIKNKKMIIEDEENILNLIEEAL